MKQPFFVGDEVVAVETVTLPDIGIKKGQVYTVLAIIYCGQWGWLVDVGQRSKHCVIMCKCGCTKDYVGIALVKSIAFAPIERAKIKYVEKVVEVDKAITQLEKCLS